MYLPQYVKDTLEKLNNSGYSAYLVGGCVRDTLMGRVPNDFDITTNAHPDEIQAVFKDEKTLDIGKKHGTITVVYGHECVEVTTYRIDGEYGDNRHPKQVMFTDNIDLDLKRRDFTVNAIAYSPKHGFVDPYGGKDDINQKRIVCVGNADERFNEDGLRIMRGLRFASTLGFDIETETACSVKRNAQLLKNISSERINTEFTKLLCGINPSKILQNYLEVVKVFIPQLCEIAVGDVEASVKSLENCGNDRLLRMCVFFSCFKEKQCLVDVLKSLKYDNKTITAVKTVVQNISNCRDNDKIGVKTTISRIGFENTRLLYMTISALENANDEKFKNLLSIVDEVEDKKECVSVSMLDIDGKIIMDKLGAGGRKIAVVLDFLLEQVIHEKCVNALGSLLDAAIKFWSDEE